MPALFIGTRPVARACSMRPFAISDSHASVAAGLLLAALAYGLHGSALNGDWRFDDPVSLLTLITNPAVADYFLSPQLLQSLGIPFFNPWPALDYSLDIALFGLNATACYAHHLSVIWAVAVLTYLLLQRAAGHFWGFVAAALFLAGPPVAVVSQQLMSRHYATGLAFAILAILFWLRTHEGGSRASLALAAGCYLAAMLNKEVFVPLPLVLLFLGSASLKARCGALVPFLLTAALFLAWRAVMLGTIIGGYSGGFHAAGGIPGSLATLPAVFFGEGWPALAGGLILLLACVPLLSRQTLPPLLAAAAALALPFSAIHVSTQVSDLRFAFLPWWGACVVFSLGLPGLLATPIAHTEGEGKRHPIGMRHALVVLAALGLFGVTLSRSQAISRAYDTVAAEFDVQGRFLRDHDETVGYVPVGGVANFLQFQYATSALKRKLSAGKSPVAIPFADSAPVLAGTTPIHAYDPACRCMRKGTGSTQGDTYRPALPMAVLLDRSKVGLAWHFRHPPDSACFLTFPDLNVAATVPCSGEILFPLPPWLRGSFVFFVRTADGLWNASPSLVFPGEGQKLEWSPDLPDPKAAG